MGSEAPTRYKPTDGPISRLINRRISAAITGLILRSGAPITPNQVSLLSLLLCLIAGALIAYGELLLGGLLVQASSIIDGVDGELARALRSASIRGGFLDSMLDRYGDVAVYLGIGAFIALEEGLGPAPTIALAAALSGDLMVSYLHLRGERDMGVHPSLIGPLDGIASRDVRLFLVFVFLVLGQPLIALASVAVLAHVYVATKTAYALARWSQIARAP